MAQYLSRSANRFLKHSYTWVDDDSIPVLDDNDEPTYDSNGIPITIDAAPISDKKCLFLYEDIVNSDSTITQHVPTLYVLNNDLIDVNDLVQDVISARNIPILKSARVESIDKTFDIGESVLKVLRLKGATTQ